MPPSRNRKLVKVPDEQASDDSDRDEGSHPAPKHKPTNHFKTAQDMLDASRRRREAKHKAIETEHAQRIEEALAQIEAFYEDRENKMAKIQAAQWDELTALLKTRRSIERNIFALLKAIEQRTVNLSSDLIAMYEGRLNEIAELNTTGKISMNLAEKI